MSSSNNILSQEQQFKLYLEGKLSETEITVLKNELESNPFYKDAFDGYTANPRSIESLSKLKSNKQQFVSSNFVIHFYFFFIVLSLIGGSFFLVNLPISFDVKEIANAPVLIETEQEVLKVPLQIQELTDEAIDNAELKVETEQVQYKSVMQNHSQKKIENSIVSDNNATKESLKKIPSLPIEPIKNNPKKEVETETVPLISLHGLINVNYSKIETNFQFKKTVVAYVGVPANIEVSENNVNEPSHELKTEYIDYVSYLGEVHASFKRNNFKKALKGYKEILQQHPADLNAHFYSAICYFNINQSAKALEHLEAVLNHHYATFRQEGEWYKAQVLVDLKRNNEAVVLLDKIIEQNDFYATQALVFKLQLIK